MNVPDKPKIFISYRTFSGRGESEYFEDKFSELGISALRISIQVDCPHPKGTVEEWDWFSKRLSETIFRIPHILVIAAEGTESSQWVGWEILSSFRTGRCLFICWISGTDPRRWITPLPRWSYRFFPGPTAFLMDAREFISAEPVRRIAFPNLTTKILSAIPVLLHLTIAALVFDISRRVFHFIGFPAQPIWSWTLAILIGAFVLVLSFPRRAVLTYKLQQSKMRSTHLVYEGQTGSGIALLVALVAALPVTLVVASFNVSPTHQHIGTIGVVYLFLYSAFMKLYKSLIGYRLAEINGQALIAGARRTMEKIDAARQAK